MALMEFLGMPPFTVACQLSAAKSTIVVNFSIYKKKLVNKKPFSITELVIMIKKPADI
jgi:hypothetical protein